MPAVKRSVPCEVWVIFNPESGNARVVLSPPWASEYEAGDLSAKFTLDPNSIRTKDGPVEGNPEHCDLCRRRYVASLGGES